MLPPDMVQSTLTGLNVDEDTVQFIVAALKQYGQGLEETEVRPTGTAAFGPSASGGTLAYHTSRAQTHLAEAMENLVTGLQEYRKGMQTWHNNIKDADRDASVALNRLRTGAGCADAPVQNPTCSVPTEDS